MKTDILKRFGIEYNEKYLFGFRNITKSALVLFKSKKYLKGLGKDLYKKASSFFDCFIANFDKKQGSYNFGINKL